MKLRISVFFIMFCCFSLLLRAQPNFPRVFENREDYLAALLQEEASLYFKKWEGDTLAGQETDRAALRTAIIKHAGALTAQTIPLNFTVTAQLKQDGYSIRNGFFQTRPGVDATISLYVPDG